MIISLILSCTLFFFLSFFLFFFFLSVQQCQWWTRGMQWLARSCITVESAPEGLPALSQWHHQASATRTLRLSSRRCQAVTNHLSLIVSWQQCFSSVFPCLLHFFFALFLVFFIHRRPNPKLQILPRKKQFLMPCSKAVSSPKSGVSHTWLVLKMNGRKYFTLQCFEYGLPSQFHRPLVQKWCRKLSSLCLPQDASVPSAEKLIAWSLSSQLMNDPGRGRHVS